MNTIKICKIIFSVLFFWSTIANAQNLTISSTGETGTSGTNWSISGNVLNVAASGSATINPSVITNHLANNGDLTINLPWQSGVARNTYINNIIAYTGASGRTLTINSPNNIVFASTTGISSSTASLNIVLRTMSGGATASNSNALIQMDGVSIATNGGHFWAAGGIASGTWNGLTVGNSSAYTYDDDNAAISIVGSTITTSGGNAFFYGISANSSDDDGANTGINVENSSISSGTGSIYFAGGVYGRYTNGTGMRVYATSANSITSTSGTITIYGYGTDATTNSNSWRLATAVSGTVSIKSVSGAISVTGEAAFAATINDKEGLVVGGGAAICSQTGNITLRGTNTLETSGQYSNSIRFNAANAANSIRIGYDGTNAYSGNIVIEGNSVYQRNTQAGAGSIAVQTTGTLTIQPTGTAFTYMRAGDAGTLTFDDDWNFGTTLGGFVYGKTTNATNLTYSSPLTTAGPISIYSGDLIAQQNLTSNLSNATILLQATGRVELSASRTIQTNGGAVTLSASSGGVASSNARAIYLNTASQILSNGGNITLGGGYAGSEGSLYAATNIAGGGYAITLLSATLNAAGGNIKLYGRNVSSYGDGIYLSAVSITTTGSGTIGIYGDSFGGNNGTNYFGGVTFANDASTIQTVNGNLTLKGLLTESQSTLGYGINFYRSGGSTGLTNHIQILSQTGNIQITGDRGTTTGGGIGHSSWGHVYFGSPANNSFTASGSVTLTYSSLANAGYNGFKVKTTGAVTYEPAATSFIAAQEFPANTNYILADGASSLTIGKTTNTSDVSLLSAISTAGPISAYGGNVYLYDDITSTNGSNITILGSLSIYTAGSTSTSRDLTTAGGTIRVEADSDASGAGLLNIDFMSFNSGSGPVIIRGETVSWETALESYKPFINTTGTFTYESNDAAFGIDVSLVWFKIANGTGGINIGKTTNSFGVNFNSATALTVNGPVNVNGTTLSFTTALTVPNNDLILRSSAAVTQSAAITATGLLLNGTGTVTLTNVANNFVTVAGGAIGSLLGATQIIDVSGGLTIGTVGTTSGLTGSSTIRVETLAGNLTLAGSIITPSTSTDAVILTAAKSTAIGVPTGGDIVVSGSPTITMGTGAIAKLYSGYDVTSTGLTNLAGGASNVRINYDETTTTYNPVLSASNKYAIYRTALGYGDLNIVGSGGDAEGTTWTYANGVIKTTSGTANVLNTVVETKLNVANLSIEANKVTFSANVTGTTSNSLSILSKTHILNTIATTITTQGGAVLFASNVDDLTDIENTVNGYILFGFGLTMNTNSGDITFGGGNVTGTDYALGTSAYPFEGIRIDGTLNLNSSGGNINMKGKSYAVNTIYSSWGVGFYALTTGSINSGTGTVTLDGFSQSSGNSYSSALFSNGALTITSANTTADAIQMIGKSIGNGGEAWGLEAESALSLLATGTGGGITVSSSQQDSANNYDIVFRGETNILAKSGPINLLGGQSGGIANGTMLFSSNAYLGSKASSAVSTSSSNITIQYDIFNFSNLPPKLATSGTLNWKPASASFGQNVGTDYFAWSQNSQTLSGLTIGKSGNTFIVYLNSAITVAGPVNVYGATIGISGALTASGSDVSLYANTAVTQTAPIIADGLSLNGTGTFTLTNTSNNFTTLAGGAVGSLLGATQVTDVSGGLTIGTIGSNTGLKGSSTIRVETLAENLTLAGSISTTSTSTDAVILTAAKNTAIGVGTGGDIILSGTPTITMGSGGIAKLFSGLESTSTGLTTLAGGSANVRNNYDETTSTFSPVLSANNKYAIYRTSAGVGALTIVSSSGDAINSTWTYDNGVINTITTPVNILSSVIQNYLSSGPLTINAGNTTVSSAISSASSNALVFNANSTLSNTTPTTTVDAAITNAGSITINTGTFNFSQNISTTSTAAITISATNQISTSTNTRRTISTQGGNITLNADNDANGIGWLDIDYLTLDPGAANIIVRTETFNINPTTSLRTYINGTGSFTFEPNDASFGQDIGSSWFVIDQDANGISGFTFGKSGNTANVYLNSAFTVAGPISVYGNYVEFTGNITSSANGDIFIKSLSAGNPSVSIAAATINKSAGTGTLTFQANGRVLNYGTLSATGTGKLNVVMWSDYDNTNNDGGVSHMGTISTNGGHVWMGGSNAASGSYTWNGLTVGDGPSIGSSGYNGNAMDMWGPITTAGGDVLAWADYGYNGANVIASDGTRAINAGSGNITFIAPNTSATIELTSTGVISLLPNAGSYAGSLTLGGTLTSGNFTFNTSYYNGLKINSLATTGLVIGNYTGHMSGVTAVTQGNTSTVTASSALSAKSLAIYGGSVVASAALTAAGNIILDGDNGSFLTQNTKGVEINAAVTTTNNGNITIHGRGGNATAINTHGINVTNLVEAVGTGNIELIGYGGLSANGSGSSCHGVNIEGANAWVKSNGGNVAITGFGGGAGAGTYSQGVPILTNAKVSAAGPGTVTINGTGGVNTTIGLRGVVITSGSSVYSAGGAISITGTNGTNGSDNSDGVTLDMASIGSNTSGPITIIGTAGGGTGSEAISMNNTNTIGGASHANNIVLRGNNMALAGTNSVLTTGQVTVEPFGDSFSSALTFPISNLTIANTITGLTLGKATNTANITFANPTTVTGPITAYGGTITLDANLTASNNVNNGTITLYTDNPIGGLSTARTLTAAGAFKYIPRTTAFTADVTYPIANLTATSAGLTIGKTTNDKNITITQDVTGPFGIELYGNDVTINSNLTTTGINAIMYLKGNTTIAAGKSITSGGDFTHDGNMTFKSTATGTAAFGTLGGSFTTVTGASTVERYIPAFKRSFRFLSPSVTTSTSIRKNWQEDGSTAGGLGTHITGTAGSTNGFDTTATNNPSLFTINHTTGAWVSVTNTNSNTLTAGTAYRLMVRGDRLTDLTTNTPTVSVTTLRATGVLKTGDYPPTLNQATEGYSFVGNPYQAPVDIKAVLATSTNMNKDVVYYWDPTINDRGGYVTRTLGNVNQNSVDSSFNQYLQPGQAVFVKKDNTANVPTMTITENHKSIGNGTPGVFRNSASNEIGTLRANLKASVKNQWTTVEGALAIFHSNYSWGVTQEDATKLSNLDEEVSFVQNNTSLAIAMQSNPAQTDELFIKLNNTRYTNYQWQFELTNYDGLTPYLFDNQNNTLTKIDNNTIIPFTVVGLEQTRFKIVFQNGTLSTPNFSNKIVLYPNPGKADSSFYLTGITNAKVTLCNILGQNLPVETTVHGTTTKVKPSAVLIHGVYIVSVTQEGKTAQVKWIVE